ncbi:lipopolysaccharide biosynthesis protein [Evansella sp. AB-rgal1]|uniref:lipopolysaccharide biosynthesis protein n=1 Tax=Evansella sp. AB-rgal1 TaxID=3242696 RepID=UPI00359E9C96
MEEQQLRKKILVATKWSSITEIIAKIIVPLTTIILARVLAPEAFGVIATITMIISFVEMFTDAGFQKYLVQHEFKDEKEKHRNANVAFWTNFVLALFLWGLIITFNEQIAILVGNPGLGIVVIVACVQLPLTSFSSIQMALFRRDFNYKTLFIVRVISILIPFIVTIPLAVSGFNYWSLIIGTIVMHVFNAVFLTIKSNWKPTFFYNLKILKEMLSFSMWSLIVAIFIWISAWVDAFIIGYYFSEYYLGIYKTSTIMVNSILGIITGATVPILFSALSRLQNDNIKFNDLFFKFQRLVSALLLPIGIGVFLFRDLVTQLMLGDQWKEASVIIGIAALSNSITIVLGHFSSIVYQAKGKPKLSLLAEILHLVVLVPTIIISAKYGFWVLVYARSLIRIQIIIVHLIIMKLAINIQILKTLKNVLPSLISAGVMWILGYFILRLSESLQWNIFSIVICVIFYFGILLLFPSMRKEISLLITKLLPDKMLKKVYLPFIKRSS